MLIVPNLNAIFILPPRTGSETLMHELFRVYPGTFLLYRHAEASAVPPGYDGYRKVGFVRHPHYRLLSLFTYISTMRQRDIHPFFKPEVKRLVNSVRDHTFESWVLENIELFIGREASSLTPFLYQEHHIPETRRSLAQYLCPDLGTTVLKFQDLHKHMRAWGLDPSVRLGDTTHLQDVPPITAALHRHYKDYFSWEMGMQLDEI